MIVRSFSFCLLLWALLLAGCSTPATRAKEHADFFGTLPVETQARLEAGQPAIGDTKDMVYIALGEPDTILSRRDTTGLVYDIWSYDGVYYTRDSRWVRPSMFHRPRHDGYDFYYNGPEYVDVQHEYERLRIEFDAGKVKAIEQRQK